MKPVNIYGLTRVCENNHLGMLERNMSERSKMLQIKEWEVQGIKEVADNLFSQLGEISRLYFYYSFHIPKLGKEFDLLRISDESIINIELKSRPVLDESIKKQLEQNRYYLASFGINIRSYTYISSEKRLVRLTNGGRLIETDFAHLAEDIKKQINCFDDHIETLFREEDYLISPLTDPERFLQQEYFLTSQQRDIRNNIVKNIKEKLYQGFTGMPGTGKTLLLYDIAMKLSTREKVAVLHFGAFPEELVYLDGRLKRIDFFKCRNLNYLPDLSAYNYLLVDEGHYLTEDLLKDIISYSEKNNKPVVFSYDLEDVVSPDEMKHNISGAIRSIPGFSGYTMTNRIRTNKELSAFIRNVMFNGGYRNKRSFPSVSAMYAGSESEIVPVLSEYLRQGYVYIYDEKWGISPKLEGSQIDFSNATCREYEKVVIVVDKSFFYDDNGYLRKKEDVSENDMQVSVRSLFHGLSRAKSKVGLVIFDNIKVFETVLYILEGYNN